MREEGEGGIEKGQLGVGGNRDGWEPLCFRYRGQFLAKFETEDEFVITHWVGVENVEFLGTKGNERKDTREGKDPENVEENEGSAQFNDEEACGDEK